MAAPETPTEAPAAPAPGQWTIRKRDRYWMVIDPAGELLCITLYKRGAEEVVRRLAA